ncbi:hypothetical protein B4U80_07328 [Leptotrombidium deliense]|uniref:Spaetzle domain-containing protein n=1 Tax=Leptotrombidium deliense TaxID=299467 RepID=A0A443S551_9ACAR|nr:hypothetical protein B4U80_07328 [Leptotrombidium deliense]
MFGEYKPPKDENLNLYSNNDDNNHYATYDGNKIHRRPRHTHAQNKYDKKIDACESAVEIITPYWASNSAGKIRAIVNTQHLQQAIQQEVCQ